MTIHAKTKLLLWGGSGQMGAEIQKCLKENTANASEFTLMAEVNSNTPNHEAKMALAEAGAMIDFSHHKATARLCTLLGEITTTNLSSVLIGTTGLSSSTIEAAEALTTQHGLTTLVAPNTSLGIMVLHSTIKSTMKQLGDKNFDVELIEHHHNKKHDAPSGTAKLLLSAITHHPEHGRGTGPHPDDKPREKGYVGVHAVRGGGVFGRHELHFISPSETLSFSHEALSRTLFAEGALTMASKLANLPKGFYRYEDLPENFLS